MGVRRILESLFRLAEQQRHAISRQFRRVIANRLQNLSMLKQLALFAARWASSRRTKRAFSGAANRCADCDEKAIAARLEDRQVEIEIGANERLRLRIAAVHPVVRFSDRVERRLRCGQRREGGGRRLDYLPQRKKLFEPDPSRRRLEPPCEHFRVQSVPRGLRAHARPRPRPSLNESLGDQDAVGLPQRGARDRKLRAHLRRLRKQRAWRASARNDFAAEAFR